MVHPASASSSCTVRESINIIENPLSETRVREVQEEMVHPASASSSGTVRESIKETLVKKSSVVETMEEQSAAV